MFLTFDAPKRLANIDKHGFDFEDLTLDFFINAQVQPTNNGRFKAVGLFNMRIIIVIFKPLGKEAISIISMRTASKSERTNLS